ncbi:MAG: CAP domain-containing protein [Yoonia sp.]|nr:CAP domain-containing protein [Yoonia sp.]MDG1863466.1 CAP domain-containing protein [Yoonia sp.]
MFKVLSLLAALALGACVPIIVPVPISAPPKEVRTLTAQAPLDVRFDQVLAKVRQQRNLAPLAFNAQLAAVAQVHAADMVARGYFSHVSPEGANVTARASDRGLPACGLGENIAQGQISAAEVFEGWMGSGPHRRNILNPRMASYGLGRSGDTWVLILYAPC